MRGCLFGKNDSHVLTLPRGIHLGNYPPFFEKKKPNILGGRKPPWALEGEVESSQLSSNQISSLSHDTG